MVSAGHLAGAARLPVTAIESEHGTPPEKTTPPGQEEGTRDDDRSPVCQHEEGGGVDLGDVPQPRARSEEAASFDRGDPNRDPCIYIYEYRAWCLVTTVNPF